MLCDLETAGVWARLATLTDVQRERWVDHRLVGMTFAAIAARDHVDHSVIYLSVKKADELLARYKPANERQAA